ncbi:MAG: GtrA family protein [Deltaproteobacteria bacterium]|nr:GtrA family protein [Deltaproteobacteria bacterium]
MRAHVGPKHEIFARSVLVGALATIVDLVMLALLIEHFGWSARAANLPALLAGGAVQLVGNKLFAFEDRSRRWVAQGVGFALVEVVALGLNAGLFHVLSTALPFVAARLIATFGVYVAFSFPMWTRIFATPERE